MEGWGGRSDEHYLNIHTHIAKKFQFIYFQKKELCGLSPHFHIQVSVSDLYIPTIGPPIFLKQNRQTDPGIIKIAHRNMNVGIGTVAA
jgi:hypothetical protein